MTIEAAQYISDLNVSYPRSTDLLREGDDHIRMTKNVLQRTFPEIKGSVTMSHTKLNSIDSATQVSGSGFTIFSPTTFTSNLNVNGTTNLGETHTGALWSQAVEIIAGTPFIDFHFNNSAGDHTARIIQDAANRINIEGSTHTNTIDVHIDGNLGVDKGIVTAGTVSGNQGSFGGGGINTTGNLSVSGRISTSNGISSPWGYFNSGVNPASQGIWLGWNSSGGQGEGNIKVNRGGGNGGLEFTFVNNANNTVEGSSRFNRDGTLNIQQGGQFQGNGNIIVPSGGGWNSGIFAQTGHSDLNGALGELLNRDNNRAEDARVTNIRGVSNTNGGNLGAIVVGIGDFGAGDGYGAVGDLQIYRVSYGGWVNRGVG